jgi:hypothetical protein
MSAAPRVPAFLLLATLLACTGEHQDAGEVIGSALPGPLVAQRDVRQTDARAGIQGAGDSAKQILFGDLPVSTLPPMPATSPASARSSTSGASTITPKV